MAARLGGLPGSVGIPESSDGKGSSVGLLSMGLLLLSAGLRLLSVGRGYSIGLLLDGRETHSAESNSAEAVGTKIGLVGVGTLVADDESCGGLVGWGVADGSSQHVLVLRLRTVVSASSIGGIVRDDDDDDDDRAPGDGGAAEVAASPRATSAAADGIIVDEYYDDDDDDDGNLPARV